eukprot:TRINITY_DN1466_c0_g1_i2.p1 TRINITY_DN1466_c0_g1~~TRINITY_DN1466_c0_g1_i2.p1  ORF type:complete len:253 (+),score=43.22 TRINITY_DN1466_c0_g1_i2:407-1165(+)
MKPGLLISLVVLAFWTDFLEAQLSENFYANKCPNVESIVRGAVNQKFSQTFVTIPGTLRLFFHDCLVEGCDGSVIIASTSDNKAEKDFEDNQSLAGDGFDTVIKAKQAVEKVCPNTVSCADILALATRDVIRLAGGPSYKVELGRRDGRISKASRCQGNIPKPTFNVNQLMSIFSKRGLSLVDMVALSGNNCFKLFSMQCFFQTSLFSSHRHSGFQAEPTTQIAFLTQPTTHKTLPFSRFSLFSVSVSSCRS